MRGRDTSRGGGCRGSSTLTRASEAPLGGSTQTRAREAWHGGYGDTSNEYSALSACAALRSLSELHTHGVHPQEEHLLGIRSCLPREPTKSAQQLASGLGGAHRLANGQSVYTSPGFAATAARAPAFPRTLPPSLGLTTATRKRNKILLLPASPSLTNPAPASPRRSSVSPGLPGAACLARTRTARVLPAAPHLLL